MARFGPDKYRVIQKRIPETGVLANGAAVTAFTLDECTDGQPIARQTTIRGINIAHVDADDAAVSTISELILFNRADMEAKDKIYEDTWSDFTQAESNKYDGSEVILANLDGEEALYGTIRIKSGSTDAAVYLTITMVGDQI